MTRTNMALTALLVSICFAAQSEAAYIVQPIGATSSAVTSGRTPDRAYDGDGLSNKTIVETNDPIPGTYPTHNDDGGNENWLADNTTPFIIFDLGSSHFLEGLHLWNHNATSQAGRDRGIRDATITFSNTSGVAGFGNPITYSLANTNEFAISPGGNILGETKLFGDQIEAQWVRFDISANHGATDFTGISEVRFLADVETIAPVPEPTSLTLALGLVSTSLFLRRRRARCNQS